MTKITTRLFVILGLLLIAPNPLWAGQKVHLPVLSQDTISQKQFSTPSLLNSGALTLKNSPIGSQTDRSKWIKLALSPTQCRRWRSGCMSACYRNYNFTSQYQQQKTCTQRCESNYQRSCGVNRPSPTPTYQPRPTYTPPTYNRPTYQPPRLTPAQIQQQRNAKRQRCRQRYLARCTRLPLRGVCNGITRTEIRRACGWCGPRDPKYYSTHRAICKQRGDQWFVNCRSQAVRSADAALRAGGC